MSEERRPSFNLDILDEDEGMLLFVGSLNCIRHRPYIGIGERMQKGQAALLLPSMSDFASGHYLNQIKEAIVTLSQKNNIKKFTISCGCQWVILSTDGELIKKELKDEYDIDLTIRERTHLDFDH